MRWTPPSFERLFMSSAAQANNSWLKPRPATKIHALRISRKRVGVAPCRALDVTAGA